MGTTALTPLPYPESTDQPFVHLDIKALADATTESLYVASATAPPHKPGRRWYNTTTKAVSISDGTAWNAIPQVQSTAGKSGAMPAGATPIIKTEKRSVTTGGTGLVGETFATPFPNGISTVHLQTASGTAVAGVIQSDTITTSGFTAVWSGVNSTAIVYYYTAIGW